MNTSPKRWCLRWWHWTPGVLLVMLLAAGGWLALQARPKHACFEARRTAISGIEPQPVQAEAGGFVSHAVRVRGENGLVVDLRVLRPIDDSIRRPLVVVLGGHRTGRDAVDLLGAPGPIMVAALDYPYDGPERPRGWRQSLATIPAARVELVGVSLGVPFAAVAGALDPRFRRVWLIHDGAGIREWLEHNLRGKVKSDWLRPLAGRLAYLLAHGPTLEPEYWTPRIAPRPVIIIGAREDRRLPVQLVERLHAAAGAPRELIWLEGGHVDRRPEAVRRLLETVRARLLEN